MDLINIIWSYSYNDLVSACKTNNTKKVKTILSYKINLDNDTRESCIFHACTFNNLEMCELLIKYNYINTCMEVHEYWGKDDETILHVLIKNKSNDLLKYLYNQGLLELNMFFKKNNLNESSIYLLFKLYEDKEIDIFYFLKKRFPSVFKDLIQYINMIIQDFHILYKENKINIFIFIFNEISLEVSSFLMKNYKKITINSELRNFCLENIKMVELKISEKETDIVKSKIKDEILCPVCLENEKNHVSLCGHPFCFSCIKKLYECPLCKGRINSQIIIKIYI